MTTRRSGPRRGAAPITEDAGTIRTSDASLPEVGDPPAPCRLCPIAVCGRPWCRGAVPPWRRAIAAGRPWHPQPGCPVCRSQLELVA